MKTKYMTYRSTKDSKLPLTKTKTYYSVLRYIRGYEDFTIIRPEYLTRGDEIHCKIKVKHYAHASIPATAIHSWLEFGKY